MKSEDNKPITFVIFGATGDLAKSKLLSALIEMHCHDYLNGNFKIVGISRKDFSDNDYRQFVRLAIENVGKSYPSELFESFLEKVFYVQGDINNLDSYEHLSHYLRKSDNEIGLCTNKIFYLAVPPNLYEAVFDNLDKSGLVRPCDMISKNENLWTRVLVEKPFGSNSLEAKRLDKKLGSLFDESQIFRIDHYLAKEALQNILTFRFANAIFEKLWNAENIDRVTIKLFEKNDVKERDNFYDQIGALKDVGQNHILQMIALIAMEDPGGMNARSIRDSREKILSQIRPFSDDAKKYTYRAQYENYGNGSQNGKSDTETYFKLKLKVENEKWRNVPFIVESGKALNENRVEISIVFRDKQSSVCKIDEICHYNNTIRFNIKPDEKISVCFWMKKPGLDFEIQQKELSFNFSDDESDLTNDYEKVLYECIKGDNTLFASTEEVLRQWNIISKISEDWKKIPLEKYKKGSNPDDFCMLK